MKTPMLNATATPMIILATILYILPTNLPAE